MTVSFFQFPRHFSSKKMKSIIIFFTIVCALIPGISFEVRAEPITVIVNKSNEIDSIDSSDLSRIYKGQDERWPDGSKIVIINRPIDTEIRRVFYKTVLKTRPTKKFFRMGSPIPFSTTVMKSDLATRIYVSRVPNAIGYIQYSEVDDTIKVLKINDALPTDKDYKIK